MAKVIATDPSRRQGKFRRLVEDFAATLEAHGTSMPTAVIEQFVADRITVVASQVGISEQTVLRDHLPESWGGDMARRTLEDRAIDRARHQLSPARHLPVGLVGGLVGALGQAQLYAAINAEAENVEPNQDLDGLEEHARAAAAWDNSMPGGPPHYSPEEAANATSGLGLALRDAASRDARFPGEGMIPVSGSVLLATHRVLAAFEDRLRRGRWWSCRCEDCALANGTGRDDMATQVADRVAGDRDLLARFAPPPQTPSPWPELPGLDH